MLKVFDHEDVANGAFFRGEKGGREGKRELFIFGK